MQVLRRLINRSLNRDFRLARLGQRRLSSGLLNIAIVGLLVLVLLSTWVPTADGRASLLQIWRQELHRPHRSVERLGNLEVIPIRFEGDELFTIASPTVWDRSQSTPQLPVELRAKQVEANLNRVVEGSFLKDAKDGILTNFDPKTLQVSVVSLNDVPVIVASDSYHSQPLKLVTVTYIDADYNAQPVNQLAEQWRSLIYQNLYAALLERSPDALTLGGKLGESLLAIAAMLAASLVLWLLQWPLYRRNRRLRMQQTALTAQQWQDLPPAADSAANLEINSETNPEINSETSPETKLIERRSQFMALFEQSQQIQQQRQVVSFFRWLLAWSQVVVWITGLSLALGLFPWTRSALLGLKLPVTLLAIWFSTGFVNRLAAGLLQGIARTWVKFGTAADQPQRDALRIFTFFSALQPLKSLVIYAAGLVVALVYLGLPLSLVLCISGVIGLSVLLVCQNLVRDWVMGILMLWEDQYAIGDVIAVDRAVDRIVGLVERFNLRLTQLQTATGSLVSIANSSLTQIENLTRSGYHETETTFPNLPPLQRASRVTKINSNPFNGNDPFNGIDPFGAEATEPTATER